MTSTTYPQPRGGMLAFARAALAIALVCIAVYVAWPVLQSHAADRLLSGEIEPTRVPRDAVLPFRHDFPPNDAGLRWIACDRSETHAGWLRCTLRTTTDSYAPLHEGLDAIDGWQARWAVRDLHVHTGFTSSPVANEALQWLVPIVLLAALAGWPRRRELRDSWRSLREAPSLLALPLVFVSLAAIVIELRGGSAGLRPPDWHAFLVAPFLLGPMQEELLFRGFAYRQLQRAGTGTVTHCALVTAAFVGIHTTQLKNPTFWIVGIAVGIGLFWVRHRYRSLSLCILLHGLTNVLAQHIAST